MTRASNCTRTVAIFAGALLLVLATTAAARTETVWVQLPGEPGLAPSQFSVDAPIYAEVADDFIPVHDFDINEITWWGRIWTEDGATKPGAPPNAPTGLRTGERYLDCTSPELLPCGSIVSDNNSSGNNDVEWYYGCSPIWREQGPEMLYELPIPGPGVGLTLTLSNMTDDLDLFLLTDCSADSCLVNGEDEISIELDDAGTYYVVVEGYGGAESDYTLTFDCQGTADRVFVIRTYLCHPLSPYPPTDLIGETYVTDFTEEPGPHGLTEYHATIDPVTVTAGQRYCVSVQMVSQSLTEGEWFWAQAADAAQLEHPWIEDARLSADRWTSFEDMAGFPGDWDYDMAFELGGVQTPVENRNWGTIKALYR